MHSGKLDPPFIKLLGSGLSGLGYRFVIVLWVDATKGKIYKTLCDDQNSNESLFIKEMEDYNIFCIIK